MSTNGLSSSSPARGLTSSFSGARLPSASFSSCGSTCSTPDGLIDSLLRMPSAIPNSPEPCLDVIPGSAPIAARSPGESRTTALFSLSSPRSNMSPRTFSLSVSQPSSSSASVWSSNDERDARCFRSRATGTWEVKGEKVRPGVSRELEPSEGRRPGRGRAGAVFSASESASESRMARGRAAGRRAARGREGVESAGSSASPVVSPCSSSLPRSSSSGSGLADPRSTGCHSPSSSSPSSSSSTSRPSSIASRRCAALTAFSTYSSSFRTSLVVPSFSVPPFFTHSCSFFRITSWLCAAASANSFFTRSLLSTFRAFFPIALSSRAFPKLNDGAAAACSACKLIRPFALFFSGECACSALYAFWWPMASSSCRRIPALGLALFSLSAASSRAATLMLSSTTSRSSSSLSSSAACPLPAR